ncbi:MAG: hypothetical protein Q7J32_00605 [Sphingomonadaceae bacterium]|nr:hypothetical protein [Sphingomonadaceae bacterium]
MPIELHTSLLEIASRTETIISHHLGLRSGLSIGGDAVEITMPKGRLVIAATDETEISADIRQSRLLTVVQAEVPSCIITVHSTWDLGWAHEPGLHVAFLDMHSGKCCEITDGRLAFETDSVGIASEADSRWLSISGDGWQLVPRPASAMYVAAAREAAIGAWRLFVAQPARLV